MSSSRRTFLAQLSAAAGLGLFGRLPGFRLWALASNALVPDLEEAQLHVLALVAVDAARAAGATFADVRISVAQSLDVRCWFNRGETRPLTMAGPNFGLSGGYGIRALVDGAWGFASGVQLSREAVVQAAHAAVARARGNRPRRPRTLALAPMPPVADGRWATPIVEDPFLVPAGEQGDRFLAALDSLAAMPEVRTGGVGVIWRRANRVVASTEGTHLLQRTAFAEPNAVVSARAGEQGLEQYVAAEGLEYGPDGYEIFSRLDLAAALRRAAERAIELSKQPHVEPTSVEVGRYDLVLGPSALTQVVSGTLAEALNAERALGYRANGVGTSFLAPPMDMLGKYQVGSELLTLRADRTRPHGAATREWDDEGAKTEEFTLIQEGVIMDYLTNRQTAAELGGWYGARDLPVHSHACAAGGTGRDQPKVALPNLTIEPGKAGASLDDIIADTKRGFYLNDIGGGSDQQLLSGQFTSGRAQEIRNGKLGRRIKDLAFQFVTPVFWKSLDALGGPATAVTTLTDTRIQDQLEISWASVSAVPARFREVNVLNIGRTA